MIHTVFIVNKENQVEWIAKSQIRKEKTTVIFMFTRLSCRSKKKIIESIRIGKVPNSFSYGYNEHVFN